MGDLPRFISLISIGITQEELDNITLAEHTQHDDTGRLPSL